jgi:hypothetical protein
MDLHSGVAINLVSSGNLLFFVFISGKKCGGNFFWTRRELTELKIRVFCRSNLIYKMYIAM